MLIDFEICPTEQTLLNDLLIWPPNLLKSCEIQASFCFYLEIFREAVFLCDKYRGILELTI